LGSFLGRIFTNCRPNFSHFHKAADDGQKMAKADMSVYG
jgi:hypothetical protein